jgi:hypothetical protein
MKNTIWSGSFAVRSVRILFECREFLRGKYNYLRMMLKSGEKVDPFQGFPWKEQFE